MKLSALLAFPLLLSSSVAYATRDVIQARQVHAKKSLIDVCAALDLDVDVGLGGIHILGGHLDICLCLSVLPGFLDNHPVAKKVVNGVGRDKACDYFTGLVRNQKGSQQCKYPQHASPFCNTQCPCDFTCQNGYTASPAKNPTDCICKPPHSECNGVCGFFPHGCGSQKPGWKKRSEYPTCPAGKTLCGVPDNKKGHDCVDINKDAESCGGCATASPFGGEVTGKNCNDIPNIKKAACENKTCKVLSCKSGYSVSSSHDSCVKSGPLRVRQAWGVDAIDNL